MKSFFRYLLVCLISIAGGALVAHQIMRYQIRSRVVPFDRDLHDKWCIYLVYSEPHFNFGLQGTNVVFWKRFPPTPDSVKPIGGLEEAIWNIAKYSKDIRFLVSFSPELSIAQIEGISQTFREVGLPPIRCLIEDNAEAKNNNERRFKGLKVGESGTFYWHMEEWHIDDLQEEASKNLKSKGREAKQ